MDTRTKLSRRGFLRGACAAGALASASTAMPRWAWATGPGAIKRLIIVNAKGGVRWTAAFDGQTDPQKNPWGLVPASVLGASAPSWGFSRQLIQKPLPMNSTNWAANIYPYISGSNTFNTNRPTLTKWNNAALSSFVDLAKSIAVARVTANPGGTFDSDHASASQTVATGYRSGTVGLVTVLNQLLSQQLGSAFAQQYDLPAVQVGSSNWGRGIGAYASARPIGLSYTYSLPTVDPGNSVTTWGRKMEADLDTAFGASRQAYMQQAVADFVSDKANGDAHVKQLIDPALHITSTSNGAATLGKAIDGVTPVTNDMLSELFGLASSVTPAGDILFDAFGAENNTTSPTWTQAQNDYGLSGALALRLLQKGSPIACITVGNFDTHATEVIDPSKNFSHPVMLIKLTRMLAALEFGLKNVADPKAPGASLWDSTVIVVVSEFGRTTTGSNGFNSPNGANGGGTDHGMWSAWPLLGGPITAGGKLLVAPDNGGFYHQNRVFTALQQGMGITEADPSNAYLPNSTFPPITGLVSGV